MAWATRGKTIINPAQIINPARKSSGHSRPKAKGSYRPVSHRNRGEIISWINPGHRSGGGKMASKKKRKSWSSHRKAGAKGKTNPARHYSAKKNWGGRRRRRNPAGFSFGELVQSGIFGTIGAVGSKLLTQVVLGGSNTGVMGYVGNVVAGIALGLAADKGLKNSKAAFAIYVGTAIQLVLRAIADFTPYGQYASLTGIGDYQVSNFVTPQRYVDALHGAMVQVPNGFGPGAPVAIQSAGVPASHAAGMSGMSIYGGGADSGFIYE